MSVYVAVSVYYYATSTVPPPTRPAHAWISVDTIDSLPSLQPDVEVKQVWVRGAWMRVLEKDTLLNAAAVQDLLFPGYPSCQAPPPTGSESIAPVLGIAGPNPPAVAIIHSVLQNWNCSASALSSDVDIPGTLHRGWHYKSPANITLRPASTLSRFTALSGRIVAADAIVTTLIYDPPSEAGYLWDKRADALIHNQSEWYAVQETQSSPGSALARVQYRPASAVDNIVFLVLYGAAALYTRVSLAGCTVLRSRLWLLISMFTEVPLPSGLSIPQLIILSRTFLTFSIQVFLATFLAREISSSIGIAVSTVPPAVYPLFALAQCLSNA